MVYFLYFVIGLCLSFFILMYQTWKDYLALMHLKQVRESGKLAKQSERFAAPYLIVGYARDISLNLISSFWLLDPPQEWMFTDKMIRLKNYPRWKWQQDIATEICRDMLDPFDEGCHCKQP
jgi:hypothetical protein